MSLIIPCGDTADNLQTVSIEGVAYSIRFRWNNRSESWFMYLGPKGATPVIKTRIVNGYDLLKPYRGLDGVPDGALFLVDSEQYYGRAGRFNMGIGERFQLIYIDSDIISSLGG